MENRELVSIIVPIYNVQKYLVRCLNSIINQTYKNLEIILIDDGSTDKSGSICDEYKKIDKRVIVVHQPNSGVSAARNRGLDLARGNQISFIDSDDYIDLKFIESMYNIQTKYHTEISVCNILQINEKGKTRKIKTLPTGKYELNECYDNIDNSCCNKLFSKDIFLNERFTLGKSIAEDSDVTYKLITKTRYISCLNEYLYYYFFRHGSATHTHYDISKYNGYFEINSMSQRLIMFYECKLSKKELNKFFRKCYKRFLNFNAKYKNKDIPQKKEAVASLDRALKIINNDLDFFSRTLIKYSSCLYVLNRILRILLAPFLIIKRKIREL